MRHSHCCRWQSSHKNQTNSFHPGVRHVFSPRRLGFQTSIIARCGKRAQEPGTQGVAQPRTQGLFEVGWRCEKTTGYSKRYSQLKPTRAKLQNQNLHPRVAIAVRHNNKTTWRGLAWVGRGGQTVETLLELGEKLSLIKFKPTRSNSSRLKPSVAKRDTQLHRSCELGSSWLELGVPFGQGFRCFSGKSSSLKKAIHSIPYRHSVARIASIAHMK